MHDPVRVIKGIVQALQTRAANESPEYTTVQVAREYMAHRGGCPARITERFTCTCGVAAASHAARTAAYDLEWGRALVARQLHDVLADPEVLDGATPELRRRLQLMHDALTGAYKGRRPVRVVEVPR